MRSKRPIISSAIAAGLVAIMIMTSLNIKDTHACTVAMPKTLLQLFMDSELVAAVDVDSEDAVSKVREDDSGTTYKLRKNLSVTKVYKGKTQPDLILERDDYFSKAKDANGAVTEERWTSLLPGHRYLLFLEKDKDTGKFETAYTSGDIIELDVIKEVVYDHRLSELNAIIKKRRNQQPALTEWLVRLVEEPETLYDGISDLDRSFQTLEHPIVAEEGNSSEDVKPFMLKEYADVHSPEIAAGLTESQKQRISSLLDNQLQQELAASGDEEGLSVDYGLVMLVKKWDQVQMTMRLNGILQNSDPGDTRRVYPLMSLISKAVGDYELETMSYEYAGIGEGREPEAVEQDTPTPVEPIETMAEQGKEADNKTDEPESKELPVQTQELRAKRVQDLRIGVIGKFTARYQYLLARGFRAEDEGETIFHEYPEPAAIVINDR